MFSGHTQWFFLAEISVQSPRKIFISIILQTKLRVKVPRKKRILSILKTEAPVIRYTSTVQIFYAKTNPLYNERFLGTDTPLH